VERRRKDSIFFRNAKCRHLAHSVGIKILEFAACRSRKFNPAGFARWGRISASSDAMFAIIYLSFSKIPSVGIRTMRQNQRIIRADANPSTNQPQARKLFLILFNTLRRILQEYACYYNELRTHRSLNKDALIE
jgi:hypothetical protein